jgi:hypothetical protein
LHFFYGQGSWMLHVFTGHLYLFFWKFPMQFTCPFLYRVVDFWGVEFFELPVDSGYQSLTRWIAGKDCLLFCRLSLKSSDCLFYCVEAV